MRLALVAAAAQKVKQIAAGHQEWVRRSEEGEESAANHVREAAVTQQMPHQLRGHGHLALRTDNHPIGRLKCEAVELI